MDRWHGRRWGPGDRFERSASFLADNLGQIVAVSAAGWAIGFLIWALIHPSLLRSLLLENRLPSDQRNELLVLVGLAVALMLLLWLVLPLARPGGGPRALWRARIALLWAPAVILALLPLLALPRIEQDEPFIVLLLISVLGAATFAGAQQALTLFRPTRVPESQHLSSKTAATLAVAMAAVYAGAMSILTIARHNAFLTHAFDLGIHDQAMYTLLRDGYMRSTIMYHYGGAINSLGDHFSPIMFLMAPLYAIWQDPRNLLLIQSIALAAGAPAVYLLAEQRTRHAGIALALAAGYLLAPALQGINTFDFHQIALATPFLLWSLYFLERWHDGRFLLFLGLALLTKEEIALTVCAFGLYVFFVRRRYALGSALAIFGLAYFVIVVGYVMPALGGVPQVHRFQGLIAGGATGLAGVIISLLTAPVYALLYIFTNPDKLLFVAQLLLPVLFLPLLGGMAWILAVPALSVALLASDQANYSLGNQYPASMLPFLYFLAVLGIQRLDPRKFNRAALGLAILAVSLAMHYQYGWLWSKESKSFPQPTPHQQTLTSILKEIPGGASVSTLSDIAPHLSGREDVWLFPDVRDAEYILFDSNPNSNYWPITGRSARFEAAAALLPYLAGGEYGVLRQEDGILLLGRGAEAHENAAALRVLFDNRFEAEDLSGHESSERVADTDASAGAARAGASEDGFVTFGPYDVLPAGRYRVRFRLRLEDIAGAAPGPAAGLEIFSSSAGGTLAGIEVDAREFAADGGYQDFVVDLETPKMYDDIEYRIRQLGPGKLVADKLEVETLRAFMPVIDLGPDQILNVQSSGSRCSTEGNALTCNVERRLWPGTYQLAATVSRNNERAPDLIATAELVDEDSGERLVWRDIDVREFDDSGVPQTFTADTIIQGDRRHLRYRLQNHVTDAVEVDRLRLLYLLELPR